MIFMILIMIASYLFYYFTKDITLMAGVFVLLSGIFAWGAQIQASNRKEAVDRAKSNIDDAFQKRHDVLTKVFETTKGYIQLKDNELEVITGLFTSMANSETNIEEKLELQNQVRNILISNLGKLRDDEASKQFEILNMSINDVEENLSASRRFYNHAVMEYNSALSTFPTSIIARLRKYKPMIYFEVENEAIKKDIEIKF